MPVAVAGRRPRTSGGVADHPSHPDSHGSHDGWNR